MSERKHIAVYMMSNRHNTVLYIGVTNNLGKRVGEHKQRIHKDCFTNKYNLTRLVWFESCHSMKQAIIREKQLKRWGRKKKEVLINMMNPERKDLMEWMPSK